MDGKVGVGDRLLVTDRLVDNTADRLDHLRTLLTDITVREEETMRGTDEEESRNNGEGDTGKRKRKESEEEEKK